MNQNMFLISFGLSITALGLSAIYLLDGYGFYTAISVSIVALAYIILSLLLKEDD